MTETGLKNRLKIFDENKLTILKILFECKEKDICGCDLTDRLNLSKNLISYHIKLLLDFDLIQETRCGRKKIYKINSANESKVKKILEVTELI